LRANVRLRDGWSMGYERYRDWLEKALDDYFTAQDLYNLKRYSKAAFLSHQACEKTLKALLIKRLKRYNPMHSVLKLMEEAKRVVDVPDELMRRAQYLDRFFIPTRYPSAWPSGPLTSTTPKKMPRGLWSMREKSSSSLREKLRRMMSEPGLEALIAELVEKYHPRSVIIAESVAKSRFVRGSAT